MTHSPPAVPTLVSLLVCDQVVDDRLTNKKSAIGIFNTVIVAKVPTTIHQLAILASLTEISGPSQLELRLLRDSDNSVLFSGRGEVDAPNPLAVIDLLFALQGVMIPETGQYAFELFSGQELLGRRRFHVLLHPGANRGGPGGPAPAPPQSA